ncbi:aldehyde dehydrogenase family protein [Rhizoctonia solani]|uniref:Aldehyde dehydrogenase family protein n=1 Tax=Rhizoctonia solani TaxID=456999 RepID=A0A8H8NSW7_9AGAM|nr:aldehyde dehydrogenase family protein [Rhizoctonia solani]QRW19426.1 aldehyde dehydrogenase family protein [Rhizoctonia solani]
MTKLDVTAIKFFNIINGHNPATGAYLADVPIATSEQLDECVAAARAAQPAWGAKSYEERGVVLNKLADELEKNADLYKQLLVAEQGKPLAGAALEIGGSVHWLREVSRQRLEDKIHVDTPERRVVTRHIPLGVVGGIVPWNFPLLLATWKIAPALQAGNSIIIKPSPFTPLVTLHFIAKCVVNNNRMDSLVNADFSCQSLIPPGILSVLNGDDGLGPLITAHKGVDKIGFTGSTETGKRVMQSASVNLKRLTLELGGNDPLIVLPDVSPEQIAPLVISFGLRSRQNNAQFCNAAKRVYIHDDIYEKVRDALVAYAKHITVGDGSDEKTQLGPVQNSLQYNKVKTFFEDCTEKGYSFVMGGNLDAFSGPGLFMPITIIDNPPEDSKIVTQEPFGPILPIMRWKDEEDVIRRANDTEWGLGASVWGNDIARADRIAEKLEAGTVWVNEIQIYGPWIPFGGIKQSGVGVENGLAGLASFTNYQTLSSTKKIPAFGL